MKKHFLLQTLLALVLSFTGTLALANKTYLGPERITRFHSAIRVEKNCTVLITETIQVVSHSDEIKHGIFRQLPLEYTYQGSQYIVDFDLLSVKKDGKPEPFHVERERNGVSIYAGEKDQRLSPGIYEYELQYRIGHVLGLFDDFDEIYWNVNGNGWAFSIDSVSADVYLPEGAKALQQAGYTGSYGQNGEDFTMKEVDGHYHFATTRALLAGENLTVSVGWDKNHLVYPTASENFLYWLQTHSLWIIGIVGLLLTFILNFRMWWRYGRDPKPGTIIPLYYAPDGLSPAECAYAQNYGRPTGELFGATLISLASKKHLHIDVQESGSIFKSKTFVLTKLSPEATAKTALNDIESAFLSQLFRDEDRIEIRKKEYNPHLKVCLEGLEVDIERKQQERYFLRNNRLKARQFVVPFIAIALGVGAFALFGGALWVIVVFTVLMVAMNLIFARLYEQPTKEGRKLLDDIAGFVLYMRYADKERLRLMNPPTMNFEHYEENLAYAIALGVADEWAGQFEPAELERMYSRSGFWYTGAAFGAFHSSMFSDLSSTISSASVPPSTSSGSGGGGFSGGGGGGGGGGGW